MRVTAHSSVWDKMCKYMLSVETNATTRAILLKVFRHNYLRSRCMNQGQKDRIDSSSILDWKGAVEHRCCSFYEIWHHQNAYLRCVAYALTSPFANILSRYDYNRIYLYFVHDIDGFIWLMYWTWLENSFLSSTVFLFNLLCDGIDNTVACVRIFRCEWIRDARFC